MDQTSYLFTSDRLGFRKWLERDISTMYEINSDPMVMRFFASCPTHNQTSDFVHRMMLHQQNKGFCYFAVETLADRNFIGFIGLMSQDYDAFFTPCVDIGWRLKRSEWNKGYATEGATRCLQYAFQELRLNQVFAVATHNNAPSIRVMKKLNMQQSGSFDHPALESNSSLNPCEVYRIDRAAFNLNR